MEEKTKTTNVEEMRQKVERLTKELETQKILTEAYRKEAEQYKSWWLKNTDKMKNMKEDVEDIHNLTTKLIERW